MKSPNSLGLACAASGQSGRRSNVVVRRPQRNNPIVHLGVSFAASILGQLYTLPLPLVPILVVVACDL